jgi:hypothetical protein
MKLSSSFVSFGCVILLAGCAAHAQPSAIDAGSAQRAPASSVDTSAADVELSHVYLLSPGQDAVRVVVSR